MRIPTFTAHSDQPVWKQVVKAVAFFAVVSIVLVGSLALGGWGLDRWREHQNARADRAAMAALGLRQICQGHVDTGCAQRAADAAKVPVVSGPSSYGDLLVSTGPTKPGATLGFAPVPPRSTQVRYAAYEQVYWQQSVPLGFDLVTAPTSRPARDHTRAHSIVVGGVTVDLWIQHGYGCTCHPTVRDVWAEWDHAGHRYAAWFVLLPDQATPTKFLAKLLPTLSYTAPAS